MYPEEYVTPVLSQVPVVIQSPVNLIYFTQILGFCGSPEKRMDRAFENKSSSGSCSFTGTDSV